MRDKPGKPPDYYHTCYCLSGLSSAQHCGEVGGASVVRACTQFEWVSVIMQVVVGPAENNLRPADPLVNVVVDKLAAAREFYRMHPV